MNDENKSKRKLTKALVAQVIGAEDGGGGEEVGPVGGGLSG